MRALLEVAHFKTPVLKISVDDTHCGYIAFPPYQLVLGNLHAEGHKITIKSFGNRQNAFGAIHVPHGEKINWDPDAWRTTGLDWSYEYNLVEMGVLTAPNLYKI